MMTRHTHHYPAPDYADLNDTSDSLDIAAHARRAEHLTPEDMMRQPTAYEALSRDTEHSSGPWKYRPHPQKRGPEGGAVIVLAVAMIAALVFALILSVRV
jgi:hypothetical protein